MSTQSTPRALSSRAPARPVQKWISNGKQPSRKLPVPHRKKKAQPEELLNQIKAITEDGLYSVRFERDSDTDELVVKIVDSDTDEVIRQIPPKELLNLSKHLQELSGSIINITG